MTATAGGSTKRALRDVWADISGCESCIHYTETALFKLCDHDQAGYKSGYFMDQHTVQHMRDEYIGLCGPEMKLREAL
jgi:hypothetical protein